MLPVPVRCFLYDLKHYNDFASDCQSLTYTILCLFFQEQSSIFHTRDQDADHFPLPAGQQLRLTVVGGMPHAAFEEHILTKAHLSPEEGFLMLRGYGDGRLARSSRSGFGTLSGICAARVPFRSE